MFSARLDILPYDLTSAYFESDPPFEDKRQFGHSRDRRRDCARVAIAPVVTPDGFPLAYGVMPGNTSDNTTPADFPTRIGDRYGRSDRVWIMDRGIPTGATPEAMRGGDAPARYPVGTPRGRPTRLGKSFPDPPWQEVRQSVDVKLPTHDGELLVLARGERRVPKERGMRRRRLNKPWKRLGGLRRQSNRRDTPMPKPGAAKKDAGRTWFLVEVDVPHTDEEPATRGFTHRPRRKKPREVFRRGGLHPPRSNMTGEDPAELWRHYMRLTEIGRAFKELGHNLAIRPIFHRPEPRIEAHILVSFIAHCPLVTLKNLARPQAPGPTPRAIVGKFAAIQMVDLHVPTADGRRLVLARHTQPSRNHESLPRRLDLTLPRQPATKLLSLGPVGGLPVVPCSADPWGFGHGKSIRYHPPMCRVGEVGLAPAFARPTPETGAARFPGAFCQLRPNARLFLCWLAPMPWQLFQLLHRPARERPPTVDTAPDQTSLRLPLRLQRFPSPQPRWQEGDL